MTMSAARSWSGHFIGARRFLFEALPDVFPQGFYTDTEHALWERFMQEEQEIRDRSGQH